MGNKLFSSEEVTDDDEGSLIVEKLEDDVGLLIEERTWSEKVVYEKEFMTFLTVLSTI